MGLPTEPEVWMEQITRLRGSDPRIAVCASVFAAGSVHAADASNRAVSAPVMLGLAGGLVVLVLAVAAWLISRERSARAAAESVLEAERAERRAALSRRARHFGAMASEAREGFDAMNATIDLLDSVRTDPTTRLHLAALRRAASTLGAQLEHALDYEGIDSGRIRPRPQVADAVGLMREVASHWSVVAADRRLAFALFVPQHPFPVVRVDPQRLRQIADALIGDAFGRIEHGEVRLELRYRRAEAGGSEGLLSLTVHDDGPDCDPSALARMQAAFEGDLPLVDEADPLRGPERPIDVGLWRAGRLAKALGGALSLQAGPTRGAQRVLRLPVGFDEAAVSRGALLEDLNAGFGRPVLPAGGPTRGRVLLVEDDRVVQFTLEQQLSRIGYDVVCADDADEALQVWRRDPTPRVLTDLGLPGTDGVALIRALREAERARGVGPVRIVVLTGEPHHGERARLAGADVILVKPASVARLEAALSGQPLEAERPATVIAVTGAPMVAEIVPGTTGSAVPDLGEPTRPMPRFAATPLRSPRSDPGR
jgi:two-component system, NarL family, sensor histidine kinase EvgS